MNKSPRFKHEIINLLAKCNGFHPEDFQLGIRDDRDMAFIKKEVNAILATH